MSKEKEIIMNNIKWTIGENRKNGGQSCGLISSKVRLDSEEANFTIEVEAFRSQLKNKQIALLLFELYLSEAYKIN